MIKRDEHIIYGGAPIVECLTNLYNAVILVGKIPPFWKRGLIVPLHKGGSKPKDLCGSYRPVALLSSLYKLLEKIIHTRIMTFTLADTEFPNSQQQGFQKSLGCLTASFNLHETIYHNLELGSNAFASFLDTSKAFDTVWRTWSNVQTA